MHFGAMDVERPIIIEADPSEWPYEFVRWANGASKNTAGKCWGVCGIGRGFDRDKYTERVSLGIRANDGGGKLVQFLLLYMNGLLSMRFRGRQHRSEGHWWWRIQGGRILWEWACGLLLRLLQNLRRH